MVGVGGEQETCTCTCTCTVAAPHPVPIRLLQIPDDYGSFHTCVYGTVS